MPGLVLTPLGTGTCVPLPHRAPSAYVLSAGPEDRDWLLVDLGPGATNQLARTRFGYRDARAVILSHDHPDHIVDLLRLVQALQWTPGYERKEPLAVVGSAGALTRASELLGEFELPRTFPISPRVLAPGDDIEIGPWRIRAHAVRHAPASLGFCFERDGVRIAYTGDTGPCPELATLIAGADLALVECSYPAGHPAGSGHLTAAQVGEIAAAARPARIALTHLYPAADAAEDLEDQVAALGFPRDRVIRAEDLVEVAVRG
ncbi:MAG: ribonuclease Z [Planctomycetes bacterium]|nr:ribonuclease Z [Planctomycetota bacterium]